MPVTIKVPHNGCNLCFLHCAAGSDGKICHVYIQCQVLSDDSGAVSANVSYATKLDSRKQLV